ncbi:hypothetical protein PITC_012320 [Penicillium italicum]|uniref:Palmitoyltransferase pfa4 n=1 Tax=Penicillium italicum TaxID=40296 RepID=A0A0A2KFD0_PENIT|nr:hypothetical protein PITC_012320 [Penicillium italicum]
MLGEDFSITKLAIPGVSVLVAFLAYTSQYFFLHFEAVPLTRDETWKINIFALCIWICYYRTCFVDPGRLPKAEERPKPKELEGMSYLETLLWQRASFVWKNSHLPSYLGPTLGQLIHLFILLVVNSLTVFGLFVLLLRSLWSIGTNTTTIETWEIERHATLVRRARVLGGYLEGPGGIRVHIKKQEYPYDIGIWANIKQSMGGSANFISWFWPLAATPDRRTGWEFETNDFEDPGVSWPPPDPDRIPMPASARPPRNISMPTYATIQDEIDAFNRRKQEDMKRFQKGQGLQRRKPFHDRYKKGDDAQSDSDESETDSGHDSGEEAWRNSEGERLRDFGVDEEAEFYDEEDIPLGVLIERRKQQQSVN